MLEFCEKVKHSKITLYGHYLGNSRTSMGHAQNQAQFFHRNKKIKPNFSTEIRRDHELSRTFHLITI